MNCHLCDLPIWHDPTWRSLFFRDSINPICAVCKAKFCKVPEVSCKICGYPFVDLCGGCSDWERTEFGGIIHSGQSLYLYNEAMKTYLHQYKFLGDVVLAEVFAQDIHNALRRSDGILVPIPMNAEKLKKRTFSQVDELLVAANLPYLHLLTKTSQVQGKKNRQERLDSAKLFEWNGTEVPSSILLIDDLYATGTTMRHAAKELAKAGAKEIRLFNLIRA